MVQTSIRIGRHFCCNSVANLLQYLCTKNYGNTMWFDKVIEKIKGCNFVAPQCRSKRWREAILSLLHNTRQTPTRQVRTAYLWPPNNLYQHHNTRQIPTRRVRTVYLWPPNNLYEHHNTRWDRHQWDRWGQHICDLQTTFTSTTTPDETDTNKTGEDSISVTS